MDPIAAYLREGRGVKKMSNRPAWESAPMWPMSRPWSKTKKIYLYINHVDVHSIYWFYFMESNLCFV